jgi:hypothetical protein
MQYQPQFEPHRNTANFIITVHTFGFGLGRTSLGLARIGDVLWSSQCLKGWNAVRAPPRAGVSQSSTQGRFCLRSTHLLSQQCPAKIREWVPRPCRAVCLSKAAVQRGLSPPVPDLGVVRTLTVIWSCLSIAGERGSRRRPTRPPGRG